MSRFSRYLFLHKVFVFNVLFSLVILAYPPRVFDFIIDKTVFHFYLGVGILSVLFLEYLGIYFKTLFIYSTISARESKVPLWLQFSVFPRVLAAAGIMVMAASAMDLTKATDFVLLPIVIYAILKEFWVRSTLLNPDANSGKRISKGRVWAGEIFLFLFLVTIYIATWELMLLESLPFLKTIAYPANYPLFALVFLVVVFTLQLPYLMEEYIREKEHKLKIISLLSFLVPALVFVFHMARVGFLKF